MNAGPTEGGHTTRPAPGGGAEELASLAPGTVFGKYEIVRCVGTGGMGSVYEATHTLLRKRVAVKTLHPQLTSHFDFRARFLREGETLARIRHPNVVDISDVGVQDGLTFLVMEFLEGETLYTLLTRERRLDERRIANLMLPLLDGLGAAHAAGVVHRDLKPENIFLARDAKGELRPKLLDFGISKVEGTPQSLALTSGGAVLGTPLYMSPEAARGGANVDWRSDEYALGVVLYECATGQLPFHHAGLLDQMNAIVGGVYEHPCAVRPELSPELAEVMIQAMAREPERRFVPLDALGRALLPFASSRVRAYYETVFSEDGPLPESTRPPLPLFDAPSEALARARATGSLTPPRTPQFIVPPESPALGTSARAPLESAVLGTPALGTPQPSANDVGAAQPASARDDSPRGEAPTLPSRETTAAFHTAQAEVVARSRSSRRNVVLLAVALVGLGAATVAALRSGHEASAATLPAPQAAPTVAPTAPTAPAAQAHLPAVGPPAAQPGQAPVGVPTAVTPPAAPRLDPTMAQPPAAPLPVGATRPLRRRGHDAPSAHPPGHATPSAAPPSPGDGLDIRLTR